MTAEPWVPEPSDDPESADDPDAEDHGFDAWDYDLGRLTDLWDNRDKTEPLIDF